MTTSPTDLELDPRVALIRKRERAHRLWAVEIPLLRVAGFLFLGLAIWLLSKWVGPPIGRELVAWLVLSVLYAGLSSGAQHVAGPGDAGKRTALVFLALDFVPLLAALWMTGAETSVLFFVPMAHVANQAARGSLHVFAYGQIGTGGYLAMLGLRAAFGFPVDWRMGLAKAFFIWAFCLYLGVASRPADRLRRRFGEVFRVALDLLRELNEKTRQLEESREALHTQATRDAVTGLWNRPAILDVVERGLRRARHEGAPFAVVLADLDWFKDINDAYGHQAGDRALYETGRRMQALLRPNDALGRYGGEEFLVALPDCHLDEATLLAERLREGLASEEIRPADAPAISVTSSFGVASAEPGDPVSAEALVRAADHALYRAKRRGRNRVEVAGPGVADSLPLRTTPA